MKAPGLAVVVTAAGVAAGWGSARYPSFGPLLWTTLLVLCLAPPRSQRRFLNPRWLFAGAVLVGCSWLVAADHELALRHSLLFVAAAFLFGIARLSAPGARLVGLLVLGLTLTSVVAFHQASGGLSVARGAIETLPPGWRDAAATRLAGGRVFGTAALPGHFAALLMLTVPLLAERVWRSRGWSRVGWAVTLCVPATAIVLTRSLAAVAVGCALLLPFLVRNLRSRLAAAGAVMLMVVAVATVALRTDLGRLEPASLRWVNWRSTLWVFVHHPWLGVGTGGVGQTALTGPTGAINITPYTHNTPLQLLAEFGLAGIIPLAAGIVWLVWLIRRGWSSQTALTLSVASLPLHNLVDFSAYAPEVLLPWAVLTGTLAARVSSLPRRPLSSWVLIPVLGAGAVLSALTWRSEVAMGGSGAAGSSGSVEAALESARWAPWSVTPLEIATGRVLGGAGAGGDPGTIDRMLADRAWVQPRSASWAEARGRLLLAEGHPGEALVWVREARRRAPWRADLAGLEAACALRR
ncbi:MAG: O-antigen ligase family protein [Thermoanaerobaculaceae bacterium]|jgi:O-antigen ligase